LDYRYFTELGVELIRHPGALTELRNGFDAVGGKLLVLEGQDFLKNPVSSVTTLGFTIYLNPRDAVISAQIASRKRLEPEVTPEYQEALGDAKAVFDVGANIGWYTLLASSRLVNQGVVHAFEPEPESFSYLERSTRMNNMNNVILHKFALSHLQGKTTLYLSSVPNNPGLHSMVRNTSGKGVVVESTTLDQVAIASQTNVLDILKLDVEGAEPLVLEGSRETLEGGRIRHIFLEWNPEAWKGHGDLQRKLETMYNIRVLRRGRSTPLSDFDHLTQRTNLHLTLVR
jgi:FkbM family methyltransferase